MALGRLEINLKISIDFIYENILPFCLKIMPPAPSRCTSYKNTRKAAKNLSMSISENALLNSILVEIMFEKTLRRNI